MVREGEIAPVVPPAARRAAGRDAAEPDLRRSRLLNGLKRRARELGFDACRVAPASAPPEARERLAGWLAQGRQGEMAWMAETFERRVDPRALWPEARSLVMLAMNYGPDEDPLEATRRRDRGAISVYARHRDYHDVIKGRLKTLAGWLVANADEAAAEVKVFVDTAPVMEKPLAAAAGLGWQGKHTNLVSRDFGSWLFLGAIFTISTCRPDAPETDHCGACRACLDACPTKAFPAPYQIDARRCISYLTIEHPGPIRTRVPRRDRQSHLWLRRLPRRLPMEQIRQSRPGGEIGGAGGAGSTRSGRTGRPRRCGVSQHVRGRADQAHRARALPEKRADRHRQFGR